MKKHSFDRKHLEELLYQSLETELGGIRIYEAAIACAANADLKKGWSEHLEQAKTHHAALLGVFQELRLDAEKMTPARTAVRRVSESVLEAMRTAKRNASAQAEQRYAGEMVKQTGEAVENGNDCRVHHAKGLTRDLRIEPAGVSAVPPPPLKSIKQIRTTIGASPAWQSRGEMLKARHRRSA